MAKYGKPIRFIIIGQNSRLGKAIISHTRDLQPSISMVGLSSREINQVEFIQKIEGILQEKDFYQDVIIWCAGTSSNRSSKTDCMRDEVALEEFCEIILKQDHYSPRFCYFSSGGTVYGKSPGIVDENSPLNPQSNYAEMKLRSEATLIDFAMKCPAFLYIFRVANMYGGRGEYKRRSLIDVALTEKEIALLANPDSRKQYGTYHDYAKYFLTYITSFESEIGIPIIQNMYSEHAYSVQEILTLALEKNPHKKEFKIHNTAGTEDMECVELTSIHRHSLFSHSWAKLEDYLRDVV